MKLNPPSDPDSPKAPGASSPGPSASASASDDAPATAPTPLVARGAAIAYDGRTPALDGVEVRLEAGQALALIGPNGAGKSTFLKGALGLLPVVSGSIEVLGMRPRVAARRVGYMPQTDELDPEFPISLRQVVMMGRYRSLGPIRWPGAEDRRAVAAALRRVGLEEAADAHFGSLSGGQQQRGMLARAIVANPRLLLLDEPFNGLDQVSRASLLELLRELRAAGTAIVVSTHDFEIATEACTHVLLLNRCQIAGGTVAETLTPEHLEETFGHATADDEAHGHFSHGHGHYHDTGFRGLPSAAGGGGASSAETAPDASPDTAPAARAGGPA